MTPLPAHRQRTDQKACRKLQTRPNSFHPKCHQICHYCKVRRNVSEGQTFVFWDWTNEQLVSDLCDRWRHSGMFQSRPACGGRNVCWVSASLGQFILTLVGPGLGCGTLNAIVVHVSCVSWKSRQYCWAISYLDAWGDTSLRSSLLLRCLSRDLLLLSSLLSGHLPSLLRSSLSLLLSFLSRPLFSALSSSRCFLLLASSFLSEL